MACPTAGLHFTNEVLQELAAQGIETVAITLHVGAGGPPAGAPRRLYQKHQMLPEYFELSETAAARLNATKNQGKRLLAVGSTSTRVLEHCASPGGFTARQGWCDLFIYPGLSIPGGGPAANQLPLAQIHAFAAGERLRRPGPDPAGL